LRALIVKSLPVQNAAATESGRMDSAIYVVTPTRCSVGSVAIVDIGFLVQRVLNGLMGFREFNQKQFIDPWTNLFFAE
jgi:hypothetical protein